MYYDFEFLFINEIILKKDIGVQWFGTYNYWNFPPKRDWTDRNIVNQVQHLRRESVRTPQFPTEQEEEQEEEKKQSEFIDKKETNK